MEFNEAAVVYAIDSLRKAGSFFTRGAGHQQPVEIIPRGSTILGSL